ncbi:TIGR02594 family protein [Bradyrhizobium hipponense]|uniref:TIGR02594 family protein n=1 Tax=Bradyrhizobium hipponense TaxID=2605638 RepID=A0A5S4YMH0_9BRAD|nr:CHAP domain-containing protein [Bradyrhizobium hipponense]TYO65560.1 TIGR02594 family protein [Bradyrhizobium hipponense]
MRKLTTALVGAALLAVSFSAAEARPRHHQHRHHHAHHRVERVDARQPVQEQSFFGGFQSGFQSGFSTGSGVVERARQFVGETAHQVGVRGTLWCSAFLRKVTGAQDVDDRALSWERHQRVAPQVGAVVTMGRRGGGHVGIVSGFTAKGDPIVISGNNGGRVREAVYSRHRIRAWVSPT